MSESYISTVGVRERRFLGGTSVYASDEISINYPSAFDFDININLQSPQPEISRVDATIVGIGGADEQGIIYGGIFQVKRNLLNNNPSITISGDLTESQKNIIQNSISFFERTDEAARTNVVSVNTNLLQLSANNLGTFSLTVPVQDIAVTIPDSLSSIPFLTMDASNAEPSYDNPISVTVANQQLIIDAGNLVRSVPTLVLNKNWPTTRNITVATVDYDPSINNDITISYTEDLTNIEGLRFRGTNIPNLNVPNQANYCLQISTRLYNHAASVAVDPLRFDDSATIRRLAYRIQYGIGKINNGVVQSAKLFDYGVRASVSCTAVFSPTNCVISCNDTNSIARNALSIYNYTGRFIPSIEFYTDADNAANNYFVVTDPIFGTAISYRGFSNEMYLSEFVENVKNVLSTNQTLRWEDGQSRGMPLVITASYEYAKISDIANFVVLQLSPNPISNIYRAYSLPPKAGTAFIETFIYDTDGNSLSDFRDWFLDKFGSFGVKFDWSIPNLNTTEFTSFPINPVVIKTGTLTQDIRFVNNFNSVYSQINCFIDVAATSSVYEETLSTNLVVKFDTNTYNTVSSVASFLADELNTIIENNWPSNIDYPSVLTLEIDVANPIYAGISSASYLFCEQANTLNIQSFNYNSIAYTSFNGVSTTRSNGVSLNSTFSQIALQGIRSSTLTIPLTLSDNLGALVDFINSPAEGYNSLVIANLTDNNYSELTQNTLEAVDNYNLKNNTTLTFISEARLPFITRYNLINYRTLSDLKNQIELDFANVITVEIDSTTTNFLDATPINLQEITIGDIKSEIGVLNGNVRDLYESFAPAYNITFNYNIDFANPGSNDPNAASGLQVALGGYEKDGTFYAFESPSAFFEPNYNTLFNVEFNTTEADIAYILVRTRKTTNNSDTYVVNPNCYTGLARYSNNYGSYNLQFYTPSDSVYVNAWTEDFGIPAVVAVPLYASKTEVSIEDACTLESINLKIINKPAAFDQIGFLAINKTNDRFSQSESKVGTVYGLVLDNRAAWDILISPEAILRLDSSGTVLYGSKAFSRQILDDDEGFDMSFLSLDAAFTPYIKLLPLPNNPQVWILQIDPNVKRILRSRRASASATSLNGCSVDVTIQIVGRTTKISANAKVTIFYDYTCVYDIGLCDFYWNLIDPPQTKTTQVIQNRIDVAYETLIDCTAINEESDNNLEVKLPVLVKLTNIPTFENGNALLLIKSVYNSNVQNYYFPTTNELDALQRADCSALSSNIPLISRLNKEFLFLPNLEIPITDSYTISNSLITETSYLYVRPQFRFPPDDNIKDCDPNEIVIAGIGYQLKNWRNGYRSDDIVLGFNLVFSSGVYTSPSLDICCRYYYNQNET